MILAIWIVSIVLVVNGLCIWAAFCRLFVMQSKLDQLYFKDMTIECSDPSDHYKFTFKEEV